MTGSPPIACAACGALNQADFEACIRCGGDPSSPARPQSPQPRLANRTVPGALGSGSERLLGRWPASDIPVARVLLAATVLVYAAHLLLAWQRAPEFGTLLHGGPRIEARRFGALPLTSVDDALLQPWRFISACFVHFGAIHIVMNMLGLVHLARICEPMVGSVRFLITYVLSGIVGFVGALWWYELSGGGSLTAGASGAVFGMVGLVLGVLVRQRDPRWKRWMVQVVIYGFGFTLLLGSINHAAHGFGFLTGALCGWLMGWGAPQPSKPWQRGLALLLTVLCVGSIVASPLFTQVG